MPVEAESPSAGGYPNFPFRSKNALGGIGAVFRDVVFAWNVRRLHAVGRVVPMRSFFRNPFRMAFSKRFYGDAAWKGKEGAIA